MVDQQSTHKPYRLYEEDVKQNTKKKKIRYLLVQFFSLLLAFTRSGRILRLILILI